MNDLSCAMNKDHLICFEPVRFKPCYSDKNDSYACLRCILSNVDYSGYFECSKIDGKCKQLHKLSKVLEDGNGPSSEQFKAKLDLNLEAISKELVNKQKQLIASLKEKSSDYENSVIDKAFEFIEQDLEIRLESIKMDLYKLKSKLDERIDKFEIAKKNELIANSKQIELIANQSREILNSQDMPLDKLKQVELIISKLIVEEKNYIKISNDIEACEDKSLTFTNSSSMTTKTKSLEGIAGGRSSLRCMTSRKKSTKNLNEILGTKTMIGYLHGPRSLTVMIDKFVDANKPSVEVVDMSQHLKSVCGLAELNYSNTYHLVVSDFASNSLNLIDKYDSFMLEEVEVTSVKRLRESLEFKQYYAMCNDDLNENLYVCDMELHRILIFSKLKKLKRIVNGTDKKIEFLCPRDICFYMDHFYVLDQATNSIDKFKSNGDFVKDFDLNAHSSIENAFSVRVSDKVVAILDWKKSISLFDCELNFKFKINLANVLSICLMNMGDKIGRLYLFAHCETGDLNIYKLENDFSIEPQLVCNRKFPQLKNRSEFMIFSKTNRLIISLGWTKCLAIVDFY